jgi:DNA-binding transcriptional LysR family regulator
MRDGCLQCHHNPNCSAVNSYQAVEGNAPRADNRPSVHGLGAALLPRWQWSVDGAGAEPAIWVVYPPKRTVLTKVRVFIDFIARRIRAQQPGEA